jgi:hypothetical protein
MCRSRQELEDVGKVAKVSKEGSQVLRDQLYPVKMDNVPARAILSPLSQIRDDVVALIEAKNNMKIAPYTIARSGCVSKEAAGSGIITQLESTARK